MRNRPAVAALTVAAVLSLITACAVPPLGPAAPTSAPTSGPSSVPPTSSAPPAPTTAAPPAAADRCSPAMLAYDSVRTEGAMGTAYSTYVFHNRAALSCSVAGLPQLTYVDDHGATLAVPVQYDPAGGEVLLHPGDRAQFVTHEVNGYGGYPPGAPECAHPATYRHVSVVLPGGSVSLGSDGTLSVQCGSITVGPWGRPT